MIGGSIVGIQGRIPTPLRNITNGLDLVEANGYTVCQFEHTFTPTENGANILTKV